MKPSISRKIGTSLLLIGIVIFLGQLVLSSSGQGWVILRTGSVLGPLLPLLGFDRILEAHSMRGISTMVDWIFSTHIYLVCLVTGIFLTSLDARPQD